MEADKQWKNPTPVAVAIIPVEKIVQYHVNGINLELFIHEVVYARRGIEPKLGMLALPGGFVNEMERLETGGKREVKEETGLDITEDEFQLFRSEITPNNRNLIFGITPTRTPDILATLENNWNHDPVIQSETQGFVIAGLNISDAAFPLHQKALGKYLDKVNGDMVVYHSEKADSPLSYEDTQELIKQMKENGHLSQEYQYTPKHKITHKVSM